MYIYIYTHIRIYTKKQLELAEYDCVLYVAMRIRDTLQALLSFVGGCILVVADYTKIRVK